MGNDNGYYSKEQIKERTRLTEEALRSVGKDVSEESRRNLPLGDFLKLAKSFRQEIFLTTEPDPYILDFYIVRLWLKMPQRTGFGTEGTCLGETRGYCLYGLDGYFRYRLSVSGRAYGEYCGQSIPVFIINPR